MRMNINRFIFTSFICVFVACKMSEKEVKYKLAQEECEKKLECTEVEYVIIDEVEYTLPDSIEGCSEFSKSYADIIYADTEQYNYNSSFAELCLDTFSSLTCEEYRNNIFLPIECNEMWY